MSQWGLVGLGLPRKERIAPSVGQKRFVLGPSKLPGVSPITRDDAKEAIGIVSGVIASTRGSPRSTIGPGGASRHPKA